MPGATGVMWWTCALFAVPRLDQPDQRRGKRLGFQRVEILPQQVGEPLLSRVTGGLGGPRWLWHRESVPNTQQNLLTSCLAIPLALLRTGGEEGLLCGVLRNRRHCCPDAWTLKTKTCRGMFGSVGGWRGTKNGSGS